MTLAYLYTSAVREFLRFRRLAIWFVIGLALLGMALVFKNVNQGKPSQDMYALLSSILVFRLLPLASAIFSTAVVSQEVEQKTIVYLLTRPIPRARLILMRTLASMTVVAIVTFVGAVLVSGAVYGAGALSNELLWRDVKAIVVGAAAYGALFVFVSLLINRAMIVCLLFAFAWETSVPNMPGSMYYLSITSYLTAISERPSAGSGDFLQLLAGSFGQNTLTPGSAYPAMLILIGACVVASMTWFTKFEYVPREDAE